MEWFDYDMKDVSSEEVKEGFPSFGASLIPLDQISCPIRNLGVANYSSSTITTCGRTFLSVFISENYMVRAHDIKPGELPLPNPFSVSRNKVEERKLYLYKLQRTSGKRLYLFPKYFHLSLNARN